MPILRSIVIGALFIGALVLAISLTHTPAVSAGHGMPSNGWTVHIDAQKHFPNHNTEWAHHWCRPIAGPPGTLQCQLYASDDNNAALVGSEIIISPAVWKGFSKDEQATWHYHKTEIPKVNAKMPDVSAAAAKKMVAQLTDTYGKVYILWDPMDGKPFVGQPVINNLEGNRK